MFSDLSIPKIFWSQGLRTFHEIYQILLNLFGGVNKVVIKMCLLGIIRANVVVLRTIIYVWHSYMNACSSLVIMSALELLCLFSHITFGIAWVVSICLRL